MATSAAWSNTKRLLYRPRLHLIIRTAVDLAHKIHGQSLAQSKGPPIIIIHGLLGSKRNWESMSKNLAEATNKTVIAVDVRNHGESPHADSHTYMDLAGDVSQLMKKMAIEKAAVIGHSMGGRTAMVLALTEPAKVYRLIAVDISPVSTAGILNDFFPRLIKVMKGVNFKDAKDLATARAAARKQIMASGLIEDVGGLHFIIMNIGQRANSIGWMCNVDALTNYFTTIASFPSSEMAGKTYAGPTLFIGGEESNYIPPEDLNGIKVFFPAAELKYIAGVGHNVHAEDPGEFAKVALEFLNRS